MWVNGDAPFNLRYLTVYVASFVAITWLFELVPSHWLELLTAEASSGALRALQFSSTWGADSTSPYLTLTDGVRDVTAGIVRECTAIHVFAIFTGLIVPIRGGLWLRKGLSLALAMPLLFALNISRVMLTVLLTAFDVPPFAWIFTSPTVETYHYPLSFIYWLFGVALLVIIIGRLILPELGETLISFITVFKHRGESEQTI
jgi:exosortase/archaeosortase family protein